ncbi:S24 family peptidase [Brevibacillus laterosporus]|uniref:S24 family peptidase n=1 Tax=Brevibacillus laterosporus TaxID=1465 RepID=UPI0024050D0A|nr:S24 family peptidase [Brevibacillus laterosporus]
MTYAELLSSYIEKSNLSLSQISNALKEKGFSTDKGYISKLQNNKIPPAGEDLSRALAEITGGDSQKLIMAGYVSKAPEEIQPLIQWYIDRWDKYVTLVLFLIMLNSDDDFEQMDDEESLRELEKRKKNFQKLPLEVQIDFVISHYNQVITHNPGYLEDLGLQSGISKDRVELTLNKIKSSPVNRIELWDFNKDELRYDWVAAEKMGVGPYISVITDDDSMNGSNIVQGSKVLCRKFLDEHKLENGKIYLVEYNKEIFIRRVFLHDNGLITLQADNPVYPPITISNKDELDIIGKIESVEFNPNE